jgi:hypothetical protein
MMQSYKIVIEKSGYRNNFTFFSKSAIGKPFYYSSAAI